MQSQIQAHSQQFCVDQEHAEHFLNHGNSESQRKTEEKLRVFVVKGFVQHQSDQYTFSAISTFLVGETSQDFAENRL